MAFVTNKTVMPGQPGTKDLIEQYSDRLLTVRYRYDEQLKRKIKTAEIIIKEWNWEKNKETIPPNKIVHLRIDFGEAFLGRLARSAGRRWNKEKKYWELAYGVVRQLGLEDRIIWG